ncbi:Kelch repeat-containing protein, partial [Eudoraea algarum]|uniref:Kelch repeat-containing protein n=1 Tax=Eudoraea algarum TaxID=3417568 RepID=UPI003F5D51E6
ISITAINITGTDAAMFGHSAALPLDVDPQTSGSIPVTFTPNGVVGTKSASLEIVHSGGNSPVTIALTAELFEIIPLTLNTIPDQFNEVGQMSSLIAVASGGDPNENVTYSIANQPSGIVIEPTNGQLTGVIDASALTGGSNSDGVHLVTITASKAGSIDATQQFNWTITAASANTWFDKDEDETYTARHECSFVQAGDKFYLFGGRESAQTLDIYDYNSNTWTSLVNSAPIEFNHFQALEYEGLIWVIGAYKTNVFPSETPADHVWSYNPATSEWIQGPEIPVARKRGSTGLVVHNDKFYIVAGNTNGHSGGFVSWFDEYDPATGIWTVLPDTPRPRDHFHAAVIDGKLYAASGRLSGGTGGTFAPVISEVDVYDFALGTWSTLPSNQNLPTPRAAAIVANFEGKLVVAGGESNASSSAFDITEVFDPVSGNWTLGDNLNHPRHGTQGIVSGNGIFVAAGSPNRGGGRQKNMEYYGQDAPTGSPSVASTMAADTAISFGSGESKNATINITTGNVGIIVRSMDLSGPDASEFSIDSGNLTNGLLKSSSQHVVGLAHTGTGTNKSATLTINYNETDTHVIALTVDGAGSNQAPVAVASADLLTGEAPLDVAFTGSASTD